MTDFVRFLILLLFFPFWNAPIFGQNAPDTVEYRLIIDHQKVNKAGKDVWGMSVNGTIPGPTIRFTEGDYAVIYVENIMDEETSVHWHGILLPSYYDGVPYLTTPPIKAGSTFKYEFEINQAGTYWYHSHTMLQEQSGVYGSIQIDSKEKTLDYDRDQVLVLSDWTNQQPMNVMRNLKRGNEWYGIKKGTSTPLSRVISRGGFGAQLNFWKQRMEGADIADIYYDAFLTNGNQVSEYPDFKPGEKVRLRIINGSASSQFWMTFGGEDPLLVSVDGLDVVTVKYNKTFIAIAETYDFIITIPEKGRIEMRAMAQDGSGTTFAYFGKGETLEAPVVERPDKIGMMIQMAQMDMRMGAPATQWTPNDPEPQKMMEKWGMQMDDMKGMDHSKMDHSGDDKPRKDHAKMDHSKKVKTEMTDADSSEMNMRESEKDHSKMDHSKMDDSKSGNMIMADSSAMKMDGMNGGAMKMDGMGMFAEYNYDYLKSPEKTDFDEDRPRKEVLLNLTGNMWRYVWSMNGVPLAEADKIKIEKGQVVRFTLNNLTMMHHPMHLHGHFFRVINANGAYSPLKHTVNVPPMQKMVIEFDANESNEWFFHCHVLYHMMGGMARIVSYDTIRDPRMKPYPLKKLVNEGNHYYNWGMLDVASHLTELNLVAANTRNMFGLRMEYGWNQNLEGELTYERFLYDYFRVFGGINVENETEDSYDELNPTAIVGIRFFTPYMFNLDVRIDSELRPQISLSRAIMVFPRTVIYGEYEYQFDMGWVNDFNPENSGQSGNYRDDITWQIGVEYLLSRNFSLMASYDNRFGGGGGLSWRF